MLNNFGGAYTLKNIDEEPFLELEMLQICLSASNKAQEFENRKNTIHSKVFS